MHSLYKSRSLPFTIIVTTESDPAFKARSSLIPISSLLRSASSMFSTLKSNRSVSVSIRLCVLSTHFESPMMTQTTMTSGFLPFLEILSEFCCQLMSVEVQWFSSLHILLSVEEPIGNVVLSGILDNRLHLFNLRLGHLSCSLSDINLSFTTNQCRKSSANASNFGQCDWRWLSALYIRIQYTQNVLVFLLIDGQSHFDCSDFE